MNQTDSPQLVQSPPSLAWAWFHSGLIDLICSFVIIAIGLIYLPIIEKADAWTMTKGLVFNIVAIVVVLGVIVLIPMLYIGSRAVMLRKRLEKEKLKRSPMDWISQILGFLIYLTAYGATSFWDFPEQLVFSIAGLLLLLLVGINAILAHYHSFWFIFVAISILSVRVYLKGDLPSVLGTSGLMLALRYLIIGAVFSIVSIIQLNRFAAKYPVISDGKIGKI